MKLLSFAGGWGVHQGHEIAVYGDVDLGEALRRGPLDFSRTLFRLPAAQTELIAPIPRPPKVVAVMRNYADHAREHGHEPPPFPSFFAKARTCVIGPTETILLPPGRERIDVEAELGVVIGKGGSRINAAQALGHVLGFTVLNDVSDRQAQKEDGQFYRAKSWRTFCPTGPWVVTPDEFDHREAAIKLWRNDFLQQDGNLRDIVHKVERLIEILSEIQELEPGDLIATGTPAGVGQFRDPPVFLQDGDTVTVEIEGLGRIANPVRRLTEAT